LNNKLSLILFLFLSCAVPPPSNVSMVVPGIENKEYNWKKLSLREKIAQMIMVRIRGDYYQHENWYRNALKKWLSNDGIGGVITFGGSVHGSYYNIKEFQGWAKYPLLVGADYERGLGQWMSGGTLFPSNMALAATGDTSLAYSQGRITALEAKALGVHVTFSPVLDVNNNPNNPIINFRSYGDEPNIVSQFGNAFIRGVQDNGMIACAKHFPGHGNTATDSHTSLPAIFSTESELNNLELVPFRDAINAGVKMIMIGHIALPIIDPSGDPSSHSFSITTKLLRNKLGFDGLIITDGMEMGALAASAWSGESAVRAVEAGADILLLPLDVEHAINSLLEAVNNGRISEKRINESVQRIWDIKLEKGILQDSQLSFAELEKVIGREDHKKIARQIAKKSITVVKDQNSQIPLIVEDIDSLAHIVISLDDGARNYLKYFSRDIYKTHGHVKEIFINNPITDLGRQDIINQLNGVNQVIISLLVRIRMDKGISTIDITHDQLLRDIRNKNIPMIIFSFGSPYLPSYNILDTYVCTFGYGSITMKAAADALFGRESVSGQLPVQLNKKYTRGTGLIKNKRKSAWGQSLDINFPEAWDILHKGMHEKVFPGAQVFISKGNKVLFSGGFGYHTYDGNSPPVTIESIYDIASITKVLSITPIIMKLISQKKLNLDHSVQSFLPDFIGKHKELVTIRHLLTHSSGIKSYYRFFLEEEFKSRNDIVKKIVSMDLDFYPGSNFSYSDLGMILLMEIVEKVTNRKIDHISKSWIYNPLNMHSTRYLPSDKLLLKIVPTEYDSLYRKELVHGSVHDENTYLMGGVSSHAGLFSTAEDLANYAKLYLNNGTWLGKRILKESIIRKFIENQYLPNESDYALGWDTPSKNGKSSAGDYFSDNSFGHLGFTGTSMWVDMELDIIIILLTNRVHPTRKTGGIYAIRRGFHNAVMKQLLN
tara:strand:+ start:3675 stop:6500 length:2826 start_codon:yes stop_codon:yes gene_type:complete